MAAEQQQPTREAAAVSQVAARLRAQFPTLAPDDVNAVVQGHYDELAGSRIRDFVPVLVERGAREELRRRSAEPLPGDRAVAD